MKKIKNASTQKDLKDISKQGVIYKIINKLNKKYYVGSSLNVKSRFWTHKNLLRRGCHDNSYLQRAWNKYGEKNFLFVVVESAQEKELKNTEQKFLDIAIKERKKCYNLNFGAHRTIHAPETILKLRKINSGKNHPNYGKVTPLKTRKLISFSHKTAKLNVGSKNPSFKDSKIYKFFNKKSGQRFNGFRCDFIRTFDLNKGEVCKMVLGNRKVNSVKGWKVLN